MAKTVTKKQIRNRRTVLSLILFILSIAWISPLFIVVINSFKKKAYIFKYPFSLSVNKLSDGFPKYTAGIKKMVNGLKNYTNGIKRTNFIESFGNSLLITVGSVVLILLCCSMCASLSQVRVAA